MPTARATVIALLVVGLALPGVASAQSRCASAKLRAAAKKASSKIGCHRKAVQSGTTLDAECIARAEDRFVRAFAAAEARGGCLTTGDASDVEAAVDQFISDLLAQLPVTTTTTSSSSSSTVLCGDGGVCTVGASCGSNGETCQAVPQCFCGGVLQCFCSSFTYTTCTLPICPTTSTSLP